MVAIEAKTLSRQIKQASSVKVMKLAIDTGVIMTTQAAGSSLHLHEPFVGLACVFHRAPQTSATGNP